MMDHVQITISANCFEMLCNLHDRWQEEDSSMAEQDLNFIIAKLIRIADKTGSGEKGR